MQIHCLSSVSEQYNCVDLCTIESPSILNATHMRKDTRLSSHSWEGRGKCCHDGSLHYFVRRMIYQKWLMIITRIAVFSFVNQFIYMSSQYIQLPTQRHLINYRYMWISTHARRIEEKESLLMQAADSCFCLFGPHQCGIYSTWQQLLADQQLTTLCTQSRPVTMNM